jgi:iron complex outermembrane recepter protein
MTVFNERVLCIAAVLGIGGIAPAYAQTEDVGEIIVTARRMEERLQDVPISMTVFNQQELNDRNVVSLSDLAQYTPSLSVDNSFGEDNATYSLRGFTQTLGTTPSVAIYFGDVVEPRGGSQSSPAGDGAGPGDFFDLQNVQVLKGPQGTLFGRNTTGGAVLLVPNKPTSVLEGYVEASYGNYDMRRVQGVFNIPINDFMRFRIGIDTEVRDGYVNNDSGIGPSDFDNIDYTAVRASLVVDITSDIENYTIGSYSRSKNNGPLPQQFTCNPASPLLGAFACAQVAAHQGEGFYTAQNDNPIAESLNEVWRVINTTTWHLSDTLAVKNIFGYSQLRNHLDSSLFGTDWSIPAGVPTYGGLSIPFVETTTPPGVASDAQSTLSEEIQFQGHTSDGKLVWQAGGYYEKSDPLGFVGAMPPSLIYCSNPAQLRCIDAVGSLIGSPGFVGGLGLKLDEIFYRDYAAYGQATYALTDQLKLTGGVRYTSDSSTGDSEQSVYRFPTPNTPVQSCLSVFVTLADNCLLSSHTHSSAPTGVVDLEYSPWKDVMLYGKYSRGYRQGAANTNSPDGFATYAPEHVDTYEIGEKSSFHGAVNGTLNLAAFTNNFTDQQLAQGFVGKPGINSLEGIVNAGKSRIWGLEAEFAISPIAALTFSGGYTYLATKLLSITPVALPANSPYSAITNILNAGDPLPGSPKNKATLTGAYNLPIPETDGKLSAGLTLTYSSAVFNSSMTPYSYVPSNTLLNLNVNWKSIAGKPIDAEVFVTNLANREYIENYTTFYNSAGFESRFAGEPRMVGGRLRVHF